MAVGLDEDLFHFVPYREYDENENKIRSSLFRTDGDVLSVNLGSIWPLEKELAVCPDRYGLCSFTFGELRQAANRGPIEVAPEPKWDPLLQIYNDAHANLSRELNKGEARGLARIAVQNMHRYPAPAIPSKD